MKQDRVFGSLEQFLVGVQLSSGKGSRMNAKNEGTDKEAVIGKCES